MWDSIDEMEYNREQKDQFVEDIFEIAFGERLDQFKKEISED